MVTEHNRGTWGSRSGFILAAAGSAVGLGNIWGFPTQVGKGGGAAFVLVYLICVLFICFPILIAELTIGRHAQKDPVGSFHAIRPDTRWWLVGALGVLAGVGILSFYSVIAGWTIGYVWFTATNAISTGQDTAGEFFAEFTADPLTNVILTFGMLGITAAIVMGGVRSGIERVSKTLMPTLIIIMILLALRAVTLPGAIDGLSYYMKPDLSKLTDPNVFNAALGQAFFSLSLGMGAMITYGSYLRKRDGIAGSAIWIVLLDTSIALLAGFIIFPAGFSMEGFDPSSGGPGLIFVVLPQLFATLPGGQLFGIAFFVLLAMAALTSMISLLEVPVAHLIDTYHWERTHAVVVITIVTMALALPSALANGSIDFFTKLPGFGIDFLTLMSTVWNNFALPIGGLLTAIFVGYSWKVDSAIVELRKDQAWFPLPGLWGTLIRYACPAGILLIIIYTVRTLISA